MFNDFKIYTCATNTIRSFQGTFIGTGTLSFQTNLPYYTDFNF